MDDLKMTNVLSLRPTCTVKLRAGLRSASVSCSASPSTITSNERVLPKYRRSPLVIISAGLIEDERVVGFGTTTYRHGKIGTG
jgi:hypothetical protein